MRFLVGIIQCTWGFPQSLIGFLLFVFNIRKEHYWYRNCLVTLWDSDDSCSLGLFVFLSRYAYDSDDVRWHEYGHCIQSLILGPLYLPVIGIPSLLWCNMPSLQKRRLRKNVSYYSFFPEKWANRLAEHHVEKRDLK